MNDLNKAIAELRRAEPIYEPWDARNFAPVNKVSQAIAAVLQAACDGALIPATERDAAVAAALERAADILDLAEHDAEERDWRSGANAFRALAKTIRSLITQPQSDALAAVRAEARRGLIARMEALVVAADNWNAEQDRPAFDALSEAITDIRAALADAEGGKP